MGEDTDTRTVRIHDDTYEELYLLKSPGDTFDDVIGRVLEEADMESELLKRLEEKKEQMEAES